jgi:branched-chain amino acid transport system substrate-binding protein
MKPSHGLSLAFAALLAIVTPSVMAQTPYKIGLILDMSGPYADITGEGSATAARMAVQDFGGKVLGRPIEVLAADHQNKADIAGATAREWFDSQGVEAILDVAASATALAANEIARARQKIIVFNGPGTTRLTNEACGPYSVHYAYDNYALAKGTASGIVKRGDDSWFFITADYAFGHDLEREATNFVKAGGGKVLGSVRHPLNTSDLSSFILRAQSSKAKVVAFANAGADLINGMKQMVEFGLVKGGQRPASLLAFLTDIDSLGLETAQGLLLTESFLWDYDDDTRAFAKRFAERMKRMPTSAQAGVYSSTMHYLRAVQKAGKPDAAAVMKVMKETPINDFFAKNGRIREDGRMVHDMFLVEVKKPSESSQRFDYYKLVSVIPGEEAFQPLSESRCSLVKK